MRLIEALICGAIFTAATATLVRGSNVGAIALYVLCGIAIVMFEARIRGFHRSVQHAREALEALARAVGSSGVAEHDEATRPELLAANPALARTLARRGVRFFVTGALGGEPIEVGTAVVPGRDLDVRISYVVVEGPAQASFRAMSRGAATSLSRLAMRTHPVSTGDDTFDHAWIVDGDEASCRRVLDAELRASLMRLHDRLGWMQVASVEATPHGIVVRRPGELRLDDVDESLRIAVAVRSRLRAEVARAS